MNRSQIENYVMRYLESTGCRILEKSPAHVKVRLSPEADKELTGRPYYWSFVERTGAEPETMTFVFVFDPEKYEAEKSRSSGDPPRSGSASPDNTILGRYLGFTPSPGTRREPRETLTYGCARLQQMFDAAKKRGRYVMLYEKPDEAISFEQTVEDPFQAVYTTWLGVNYKVELSCDMKRDEWHSLGISLSSGEIVEQFQDILNEKRLTPQIPPHTRLRDTISLERAAVDLEKHVEKKLIACDHQWAAEAMERYHDEYRRLEAYYTDMLNRAEEAEKDAVREHFRHRIREIEWQYHPRVQVSVINCGIFHLLEDSFRQRNL